MQEWRQCPNCSGTGKEWAGVCHICRGTGRVPIGEYFNQFPKYRGF